MSDLLPFIILGLVSGSIYGLAGIGLVLTYKTSGIMNLGYGALAAAAAYVFYWLRQDNGLPWPVALLLSVVVFGALLGVALERFARLATRMPTALQISGTVGIILVVQGLVWEWKGRDYILFDPYLPQGTFTVAGAHVGWDQVIIIAIGLAITLGLYVFLRQTRLGFAMRGVVDDPDLLALSGTSPSAVRRWSWIIGLLLACLSGVLLAPSTSLDAGVLTQLVVQAFGAAAIGFFSSLPLTYVGGLAIGIASAVSTKYIDAQSPLQGLPPSIPFIVLFVALLVTKRDKLVQRLVVPVRARAPWQTPVAGRLAFAAAALAFLALVPRFAGVYMASWTLGLAYIVLFLSLGILVKTSNQVSLCHATFAAIGASTFSHFQSWMPWGVALVATGLVLVPIGAAVAIPAIRVSGVYLALATLGFGILVQYIFFQTNFMFGANQSSAAINRPSGFEDDQSFYYLLLVLGVGVSVLMILLHRTRLGRLLRGLADSRLALATLGLSPNITLTLVFAISAFLAGVFGALFGASVFAVSGASLPWDMSLTWLVLLSIVAGSLPWYAVLAALSFAVIPSYLSGVSFYWFTVLFGAFAILHAMIGAPEAPAWIRRLSVRHAARRRPRRLGLRLRRNTPPAAARPRSAPGPGLEVANLTVRFSGVVAVHDLSLSAPTGRITGLIGPNGAGKTTTFNACSGLLRPASGTVSLAGRDVTRLSAPRRARRGLGRTFQRMQLFESLTVAENVALGREAGIVGANPLAQIVPRPGDRRATMADADEAMALCGIEGLSGIPVVSLSTGQRRLVELARCLAGRFDVLMLDEPSSGLDRRETTAFAEILRRVVAERGVGILLVEHDMALVMAVCEQIHVLDFGVHIFAGSPAEVAASEAVRTAYLGEAVERDPHASDVGQIARSGARGDGR
jgi:ABC-type branched-subunit amino acid transport system ATPase component/branched-subunit amino acid ABC-type transport system permease component